MDHATVNMCTTYEYNFCIDNLIIIILIKKNGIISSKRKNLLTLSLAMMMACLISLTSSFASP